MMKIMFSVLGSFLYSTIYAQDNTIKSLQQEMFVVARKISLDSSEKKWKTGGSFRLTAGQSSLSNWTGGGDDFTLNANTALLFATKLKYRKITWDNVLELGLGYLHTSSLGTRKNEDKIDLISKHNYSLSKKFKLGTLVNFRTQFLKGYKYQEYSRTMASGFLSPGYALISEGIDYKPHKNLSLFLSPITSRWILVTNDSLASVAAFGVDPRAHSMNQLGAFATINYNSNTENYLHYRMRLDLFSNYRKDPKNIDLYMTNLLTIKVYKIFSLNWSVDMLYDDDARIFGKEKTSASLQMKSIVGAGIQVPI